jgi:hypothetical protein
MTMDANTNDAINRTSYCHFVNIELSALSNKTIHMVSDKKKDEMLASYKEGGTSMVERYICNTISEILETYLDHYGKYVEPLIKELNNHDVNILALDVALWRLNDLLNPRNREENNISLHKVVRLVSVVGELCCCIVRKQVHPYHLEECIRDHVDEDLYKWLIA